MSNDASNLSNRILIQAPAFDCNVWSLRVFYVYSNLQASIRSMRGPGNLAGKRQRGELHLRNLCMLNSIYLNRIVLDVWCFMSFRGDEERSSCIESETLWQYNVG